MSRLLTFAFLAAVILMAGCGRTQPPPQPLAPPTPLSVEEWKKLPVDIKYDEATFERLKLADQKLQTEAGWNDFMMKVIIPERKIDIPGTPGVRS